MFEWFSYMIYSPRSNKTYIGYTNAPKKRIKQHRGILSGGARTTSHSDDWEYVKIVKLPGKKEALQFEWYWKHKKNGKGRWCKTHGMKCRINRMVDLLQDRDGEEVDITQYKI